MCVLCGELITTFHWSDETFNSKESTMIVGSLQRDRMRSRLQKVKAVNMILEFYGLVLKDWQGSKFVLEDKKGRRVIINDLGDLWHKAQELCTKPIDILDQDLISFLKTKL